MSENTDEDVKQPPKKGPTIDLPHAEAIAEMSPQERQQSLEPILRLVLQHHHLRLTPVVVPGEPVGQFGEGQILRAQLTFTPT